MCFFEKVIIKNICSAVAIYNIYTWDGDGNINKNCTITATRSRDLAGIKSDIEDRVHQQK